MDEVSLPKLLLNLNEFEPTHIDSGEVTLPLAFFLNCVFFLREFFNVFLRFERRSKNRTLISVNWGENSVS